MKDSLQKKVAARLDSYADVLVKFADAWTNPARETLRWDTYRRVLATPQARNTYRDLYGIRPVQWMRDAKRLAHKVKSREGLSRYSSPISADHVPLPGDAIVWPLWYQDGLVVASSASQRVLKVVSDKREEVDNEVAALRTAHRAGIGNHVPDIIRRETLESWDGFMMELAPDWYPMSVTMRLRGKSKWCSWLREAGLPVLQSFYEEAGVQVIDGDKWLQSVQDRCTRAQRASVKKMFDQAVEYSVAKGAKIVEVKIHGDVMPRHLHRTRTGWTLIDWGRSSRSHCIKELFPVASSDRLPLFRHGRRHARLLWLWLGGNGSSDTLPHHVEELLSIHANFQRDWLGLSCTKKSLRFQLWALLLERALERYERGKEPIEPEVVQALGLNSS